MSNLTKDDIDFVLNGFKNWEIMKIDSFTVPNNEKESNIIPKKIEVTILFKESVKYILKQQRYKQYLQLKEEFEGE